MRTNAKHAYVYIILHPEWHFHVFFSVEDLEQSGDNEVKTTHIDRDLVKGAKIRGVMF